MAQDSPAASSKAASLEGDPRYPWYDAVSGDELEQGDILLKFPLYIPPPNIQELGSKASPVSFTPMLTDVIILSQSCDLVNGKTTSVLLIPVDSLSDARSKNPHLNTGELENIRKGNRPPIHMINACDLPDLKREISLVDFRRLYTSPVEVVKSHARTATQRARLLSPYKEHLSQGFARFFMRVGIPSPIPEFKK